MPLQKNTTTELIKQSQSDNDDGWFDCGGKADCSTAVEQQPAQ